MTDFAGPEKVVNGHAANRVVVGGPEFIRRQKLFVVPHCQFSSFIAFFWKVESGFVGLRVAPVAWVSFHIVMVRSDTRKHVHLRYVYNMNRGGSLPKGLTRTARQVVADQRDDEDSTAKTIADFAIIEFSGFPLSERGQIRDNKYYSQLVSYVEWLLSRAKNGDALRESDSNSSGSFVRAQYYAASTPLARQLRQGLWGTVEPLALASDDESLWKALEQVWAWIGDSPEIKFYEETAIVKAKPGNEESRNESRRELLKPVLLPKRTAEGEVRLQRLPYTQRAYDLTFATKRLREKNPEGEAWWELEWAAVYLTTGVWRNGLPRYVVEGGTHLLENRFRGYISLTIHDVESVPPDEVEKLYRDMRQRVADSRIPKIEIRPGPSTKYHTEIMARIELELILTEACQRFEKGLSVQPRNWDWRPDSRTLLNEWQKRAGEFHLDPDMYRTPQAVISFSKRVLRDLYLPALADMLTPADIEEIGRQAEENTAKILEADDKHPPQR